MSKVADCSFIHFVYPFLFDPSSFAERVARVEAATCHSNTRAGEELPMWLPLWKEKGFPRDDMLAYVAGFLNPEDAGRATARVWKLNDRLDEAFGLAGRADWELVRREKKDEKAIPFSFGEVGSGSSSLFAAQLALFRVGVGFVTVRVRPESEDVLDWLEFVSNFRFVKGQRQLTVRATKASHDAATGEVKAADFFPPSAAGGVRDKEGGGRVFVDVLDALLRSGSLSPGEEWWKDVFIPEQVMPFAVIYVDGPEGDEAARAESAEAGPQAQAGVAHAGLPEDFQLIYMLRNFFHAPQGSNPAPEDLAPDHSSIIPYAERCWFIFSLDGGHFLARDAPQTHFFRRTLPDHLRDQYFLLFLIVLQQRFALMSISQDVVMKWLTEADEEKRAEAFGGIRDRLLDFAAHGLFTQVMQREHHHRAYRKWQEVFQIKALYDDVRDEVKEIHDFLQMKRTERIKQLAEERTVAEQERAAAEQAREREARALAEQLKREADERERAAQERASRLERTIGLLTVCFGVPALIISFLGINIPGLTTTSEGMRVWAALLIVLGISAVCVSTILLSLRRYVNRAVKAGVEAKGGGQDAR